MVVEIGYGTMLDVILTIYTSFVNMVSYIITMLIILPLEPAKFSPFQLLLPPVNFPNSSSEPLSCGSPDALQNTTVSGRNYTNGANISYSCPIGHALIGNATRTCEYGIWSGKAPTCKCNFSECARIF